MANEVREPFAATNLFALFRAMGSLPGHELVETDQLCYHHGPLANPMFNGVWQSRCAPQELDALIAEARDWFAQRAVAAFFWWIDPYTQPTDLAERFRAYGFDGNVQGDPEMLLDLDLLDAEQPAPSGLTIVQATDPNALHDWRDVFVAAFGSSVADGESWIEATQRAGGAAAPWQLFVGYLHDQPIATSMIFPHAGVAGVYAVGTLPAFRGRGIGAAITAQALHAARSAGNRYAVLFSSRMGQSLYRRLGFRETGERIGLYVLERD